MPIADLPERLTQEELIAWQHYLTNEPRGERRNDWHSAQVTKAVTDIARALGGGSEVKMADLLLKFVDPEEEAKKSSIPAIVRMFGKYIPDEAKKKMVDSHVEGKL